MNILVSQHDNFNFMDASIIQGLHNLGYRVCSWDGKKSNYIKNEGNIFGKYDLFIQFIKDVHPLRGQPSIMVWGEDDHLGLEQEFYKGYDIVFVRDHKGDNAPGFPINFAIENRYYCQTGNNYKPLKDREIDICFLGDLGDFGIPKPERKEYAERLKEDFSDYVLEIGSRKFNEPDDYWSRWVNGHCVHDPKYYETLANSKICLSFKGKGSDCARHWEIMASGAVCMIQGIKVVEPQPSVYWFSDYESLRSMIKIVLSEIQECENIQDYVDNAYIWNGNHHSTTARAKYILDKCGFNA